MKAILNPKVSQFLLVIIIAQLALSCSKRKTIVKNNWQVESIRVHSDSALTFPVNTYILSFEKGKYFIKLDVNSCSGKVIFLGRNRAKFNDAGCTLICCDSPFADKTMSILSQIKTYELKDSRLTLKADEGKLINLKKS